MTIEQSIRRQETRKREERAFFKRQGKAKPRPTRITQEDVGRAVSVALRNASREIRHQIKVTPAWGHALCWACAKLEERAAIDAAALAKGGEQ
ncbi:hypothetical protein VLK31_34695 [Variovorax sp. H27-G14]|uniref:hypothetical protein n=1 Tax=Variovorax sp. H27-G14 TaxID=3111914 RepID=UPI0038FC1FCC